MLKSRKQLIIVMMLILSVVLTVGCETESKQNIDISSNIIEQESIQETVGCETESKQNIDISSNIIEQESIQETVGEKEQIFTEKEEKTTKDNIFSGYKIIEVDGGNTSGYRESNVVVDIGFGDREYWAFTNEYGQLVKVVAKEIILQDDKTEPVTSDGRYYSRMADVHGVGASTGYDRGHIIADSLGGVANAYNITPQNATLNRHGDQAYMEKVIRDAGGCSDFEAIITYPDTETQIPSYYKYTYKINGRVIVDEFPNVDPDEYNKDIGITPNESVKTETKPTPSNTQNSFSEEEELKRIDKNGNGKVTIAEAKEAGFKMPITRDHWLYKYMTDADGDGKVGE